MVVRCKISLRLETTWFLQEPANSWWENRSEVNHLYRCSHNALQHCHFCNIWKSLVYRCMSFFSWLSALYLTLVSISYIISCDDISCYKEVWMCKLTYITECVENHFAYHQTWKMIFDISQYVKIRLYLFRYSSNLYCLINAYLTSVFVLAVM